MIDVTDDALSSDGEETFPGVHVGEGHTDIRVRNLWLLFLYASRLYQHLDASERVLAERLDGMPLELAVRVLNSEVERRLASNVTASFVERTDILSSVRDRIRHLETARGGHLRAGRVVCTFEELSTDTPRNRYVLAALKTAHRHLVSRASSARSSSGSLIAKCASLALQLERRGVSDVPPDMSVPRVEVYGRMDAGDERMVSAAQFVLSSLMPSHARGGTRFQGITRDEKELRRLFEAAVLGFYQQEVPSWNPKAQTLYWSPDRDALDVLLPEMRTDVSLVKEDGQRIVLDTKFTSATSSSRRSTGAKLKSAHLYQIYAYMRTQEMPSDAATLSTTGVLLYPRTDESGDIDIRMKLHGHETRVLTVDLAGYPDQIARTLRHAIGIPVSG